MKNDLVDLGEHPDIFVHGTGDVVIFGSEAHVMLFRWRRMDGVWRRCIAAEVIRPINSVRPELLEIWKKNFPLEDAAAFH